MPRNSSRIAAESPSSSALAADGAAGASGAASAASGSGSARHRVVEVEGLGQEFMGAAAEGAGGAGDVGVGRHHHHRQRRQPRLQGIEEGEAVDAGHAHVGIDELGRGLGVERIERGARAIEGLHAVAGLAQRLRQHEAHGAVVVHHPHPRGLIRHGRPPSWRPPARPPPPPAAAG
jgi:hypothetical protein